MNRSRPNRIDQRLVRALGHPLRVKILEVVQLRKASPSELTDLLQAPLGNVAYHVRVLEKCGCIEQVATARRRGAVEHYFRARPRSYIGHQDWRKVPKSLRDAVTGASLGTFFDKAADALEAGTMDARDDSARRFLVLAYVTAFAIPPLGLILGIVVAIRLRAYSRHALSIIAISLVASVIWVLVFSSGSTQGQGFKARYIFETDYKVPGTPSTPGQCHFSYVSESTKSGDINSPRYPSNYPSSTYCVYDFFGEPGQQVKLVFNHFKINDYAVSACFS